MRTTTVFWIVIIGVGLYFSAPAARCQSLTPQPFTVNIEVKIFGGARPTIRGTTNLPDGTMILIQVYKPWLPNAKERMAVGLPACQGGCLPLTVMSHDLWSVAVKNGRFSDGPFTTNGGSDRPFSSEGPDALGPGTYILEITSQAPDGQPSDVRAIIGQRGENMMGPLVTACCFGIRDQAEIEKAIHTRRALTRLEGASIYYARYFEIGPSP